MRDPKLKIARTLGTGYAYVQHVVDKGIEWGIHRMKEAGGPDNVIDMDDTNPHRVKRTIKGTLRFFGELGSSYYDTYEDLKAKSRARVPHERKTQSK